jgi:hypothetical protein
MAPWTQRSMEIEGGADRGYVELRRDGGPPSPARR